MHYGWVADLPALLEYAERHGLNLYINEIDDDEEGVSWCDVGAEDVPPNLNLEPKDDPPKPPKMRRVATVNAALEHIAMSFAERYPVNFALRSCINFGGTMVVGLYTNYDLYNAPFEDFVETLGEKLGQKDGPKWYFDSTRFEWSNSVNDPPIDIIF